MKSKITMTLLSVFLTIFGCQDNRKDSNAMIKTISVKESHNLIQENQDTPNFVILDVRTPEEFMSFHIKGAQNIDYYDKNFKSTIDQLDKKKTYLIYCRSGNRSGQALKIFQNLEFETVYNMQGGMMRWQAMKFPL